MKTMSSDWYKKIWTLDIKDQSWVEDTENQVDFIIRTLELTGSERILDLACGFGRHALSFARRGYSVVGVDLTRAYIDDAVRTAQAEGLDARFLCADIRDVAFKGEFDVVLNLADGAIGYLENDEENLKIIDVIAKALKPGGKHFMDVCNAEHAEAFFPKRHWEVGSKTVSLPEFDWDAKNRRMLFTEWEIPFGQVAVKPEPMEATSARLYSISELEDILGSRGLGIRKTFSDYSGKSASVRKLQLMVYSVKDAGCKQREIMVR